MKKLFIIFLACWLSACGYHLRGAGHTTAKFKKIYLEGASGPLRDGFDEVLKLSSARLVKKSERGGFAGQGGGGEIQAPDRIAEF